MGERGLNELDAVVSLGAEREWRRGRLKVSCGVSDHSPVLGGRIVS